VARAAGVKKLVLSHLIPSDDPAVTDQMWLEGARTHSDDAPVNRSTRPARGNVPHSPDPSTRRTSQHE